MKIKDILGEGFKKNYSYRDSWAYKSDGGANDEGWDDNPLNKKQYHAGPRNYAIVINGKQWKVVKNLNHARAIEKTLKSKGKNVEVKITDNPVTESTVTNAGSVASVANPTVAHSKPKKRGRYGAPEAPQKKKADGTVKNALDLDNNLMGGKTVKR